MATGADRPGKPPLRCLLLLHSLLTPLPVQWDRRQSWKCTLGATFIIISQKFLITRHKSLGCVTTARRSIKHVLWLAIAARVAFYSRPGLPFKTPSWLFFTFFKLQKWYQIAQSLTNASKNYFKKKYSVLIA